MIRKGNIVGLAILFAIAALAAYAGWRMRSANAEGCELCARPLHERSKVIGLLDGKKKTFCCPACALTAHRQLREKVRILQLTDYATDTPLDPAAAFIVKGSNVNHCLHDHVLLDRDHQPSSMDFDRCSPSLIAFRGERDAAQFIRNHGGRLERFSDVAAAYQK
ncbi:MAG: nitrous oxide reductase accessory protein NosL [Bryobacterales bacterium]|nr:nitrous oxide reductase accessory protein NosL [Bryobacterales bacterium]